MVSCATHVTPIPEPAQQRLRAALPRGHRALTWLPVDLGKRTGGIGVCLRDGPAPPAQDHSLGLF
jgi:hypothetical protein